jgi:hypothetical protein
MTQQNAALVEQASAAAESMRDQAQALLQEVSQFKIAGAQNQRAQRVASAAPAVPARAPVVTRPAAKRLAAAPLAVKASSASKPASKTSAASKETAAPNPTPKAAPKAAKTALPTGDGEWEEF